MRGETDEIVFLDDADVSTIKPIIGAVAGALARKYGKFVELADVAQELWVWCFTKPARVTQFIDREDEGLRKAGFKGLQKSLYREGDRYCRKTKASKTGYRASDEFFYTKGLIEALLVARANDGKLLDRGVDTGVKTGKSLAEGGDVQAMIFDIEVALDDLDDETIVLLEQHVVEGIASADLAAERGVSRQAIDQRINRAFDKMIYRLGGESPWK